MLEKQLLSSNQPGEIAGPWEGEEGDGGDVVDEHLCEVLPLHVRPLGDGEGPVEGELHHVVPPDGRLDVVVGVAIPAKYNLKSDFFHFFLFTLFHLALTTFFFVVR